MTARPLARKPLVVPAPGRATVDVKRVAHSPGMRTWFLFTVVVVVAFFALIYSRIALDGSAFELRELQNQIEIEQSQYWTLRAQVAELQAPDRILAEAGRMGLVYPQEVIPLEVFLPPHEGPVVDLDTDLKMLLGAQP